MFEIALRNIVFKVKKKKKAFLERKKALFLSFPKSDVLIIFKVKKSKYF
jgi:hypothetical protein